MPEIEDQTTPEILEIETPEAAEEARTKLEDNVRASLAKAFGNEIEEIPTEQDTNTEGQDDPDEVEGEEAAAEGDNPDAPTLPDDGNEGGEAAAEDQPDPNAPTLPEAYRRSLKAYDWTDEDIDQNYKALGDQFLRTAERIHSNRNAELQRFADAGRARKEQERQAAGTDPTTQSATSTPGQLQTLKPIDVKAAMERYGDDDVLREWLEQSNATVQAINSIIPVLQQGVQATEQAETDRALREVTTFFSDTSLAPYRELYGKPEGQLTTDQLQLRNKVLDTAYDLMVGAHQLRGEALPMQQALMHAHGLVSRDFDESKIRKTVKKEAKKRNRGLSLKPNRQSNGITESDEPARDRNELESRVRSKLTSVFNRR